MEVKTVSQRIVGIVIRGQAEMLLHHKARKVEVEVGRVKAFVVRETASA